MSDRRDSRAGLPAAAAASPDATECLVFALTDKRLALPIDAVDSVASPPALSRVPHAGPALLGAGNLGGRIVPILDLGCLLGCAHRAVAYDGSGEILRLRGAAGAVGVWVDRVEGFARIADGTGPSVPKLLDLAPLLDAVFVPGGLACGMPAPLGDPANLVAPAPAAPAAAFLLVEAGGEAIRLRREEVHELVEAVPWTPLPRAPRGLLGAALLRGSALPILSLAVLLGLPQQAVPGAFLAIEIERRPTLIAVDRIAGLRLQRHASARRWAAVAAGDEAAQIGAVIDIAATLPPELRRAVLDFPPLGNVRALPGRENPDNVVEYLAFTIADQACGVPVACVERVVEARPLIDLPRSADPAMSQVDCAIELRGRIVPVAALPPRLAGDADKRDPRRAAPSAYVILRDATGLAAIGVDRVRQIVRIRPEEVVAPAAERHSPIAGIAQLPGGELLRIVAPERLWVAA